MCNMTVFKYQHIKKALLKNNRAEMSILSVEAAALLRKNKLLMSELSRLAEIYQVY